MKKTIKFTESPMPYHVGDIATFDAKEADKYIDRNEAVEFQIEKKAVKPAENKAVKPQENKEK